MPGPGGGHTVMLTVSTHSDDNDPVAQQSNVNEEGRERPPGGSHHGERHPNGWRVTPGPDGRGAPPPEKRGGGLRSVVPYVLLIVALEVALLALFRAPAV